jgi:plasmid maintenance system antidote protein VapI
MTDEQHDRLPAMAWPARVYANEEREARGWTVAQMAHAMGISEQACADFLLGTAPWGHYTATRLMRATGVSATFWARLQAQYDRWHAARAGGGADAD